MKAVGQLFQRLSPRNTRRLLNCYPPWFFLRVRCADVGEGYRTARVVVKRSFWNGNLNGTTFGGALAAAVDPVHAVLLWQVFANRGVRIQAWSADVRTTFEAPGRTAITFEFRIEEDELAELARDLEQRGRAQHRFAVEGRDRHGTVCVRGRVVVALRPLAG